MDHKDFRVHGSQPRMRVIPFWFDVVGPLGSVAAISATLKRVTTAGGAGNRFTVVFNEEHHDLISVEFTLAIPGDTTSGKLLPKRLSEWGAGKDKGAQNEAV